VEIAEKIADIYGVILKKLLYNENKLYNQLNKVFSK
jgi:hypothetical protein